MEKKAVSGIILMLLLTNIVILAVNIQPVKAAGGIIIRADGTIDPPTAPILRDGDVYTFTDNIFDVIVVERSNIIVDGNGYTLQGSGEGTGFQIASINDVTIQNTNIQTFTYGISLTGSSDNTISGNTITNNNNYGINLRDSSNFNTIYGNNITDNYTYDTFFNDRYTFGGIYIGGSSNTIYGNNITDNGDGIAVHGSDNTIFHNNLINNQEQIHIFNGINTWDDGYPSGGNYWSDYNGTDNDGDGIGDTPYIIDENNQDNYPLVNQHIIPEFPSWTPMLLILIMLAVAVAIYKRKLLKP